MMEIVQSSSEMQNRCLDLRRQGKNIGFVPTMGNLHEGHFSLIRSSLKENDRTVVSIFVNPLQFSPTEDLERYPRTIEKDQKALEDLKVDFLFSPPLSEIYGSNHSTYVEVKNLSPLLCGVSRPKHFLGVATVCLILFQITQVTRSYFGQKDYQQARIIQNLVKDLHLPLKISILATVREKDGLALSSRNQYLSPEERKSAPLLYKSLCRAKQLIEEGEDRPAVIRNSIEAILTESSLIQIDYISLCHSKTLKDLANFHSQKDILIAIAVYFRKARLIDNILVSRNL